MFIHKAELRLMRFKCLGDEIALFVRHGRIERAFGHWTPKAIEKPLTQRFRLIDMIKSRLIVVKVIPDDIEIRTCLFETVGADTGAAEDIKDCVIFRQGRRNFRKFGNPVSFMTDKRQGRFYVSHVLHPGSWRPH